MLLVKPLKLRDFIAFSCFYFSVVTAIIFLCFSSLNNRDMIYYNKIYPFKIPISSDLRNHFLTGFGTLHTLFLKKPHYC